MIEMLKANHPRPVDVNFMECVHLCVDASFELDGFSGVGGALFDTHGSCIGCFGERVSSHLLEVFMKEDQKTVIFELEGLAIVTALDRFSDEAKGRRLVVFTNNQSVQSSFIKCKPKNSNMDLLIRKMCISEVKLGIIAWIERAPRQSNPADELSWAVTDSYKGCAVTRVDLMSIWQKRLAEASCCASELGEVREAKP